MEKKKYSVFLYRIRATCTGRGILHWVRKAPDCIASGRFGIFFFQKSSNASKYAGDVSTYTFFSFTPGETKAIPV